MPTATTSWPTARRRNLWITTDGNALGSNDGLFALPVEGPERGQVRRFLTSPVGAETTGPIITSDARSVLVSIEHPGAGSTFNSPRSTWPDHLPTGSYPRPSVVCSDGGYIGT